MQMDYPILIVSICLENLSDWKIQVFDTLILFLKYIFLKKLFWQKDSRQFQKHEKITQLAELNY